MHVKILKYSGWDVANYCARKTQNPEAKFIEGKEPSLDFKKRLLLSDHSPLREVRLLIEMDLMNKTQNHVVRHNVGVQWFVSTLRSDIVDSDDLKVHRQTERSLAFSINLSALVGIIRKRTCRVSEDATVRLFQKLTEKVIKLDPKLFGKGFLYAKCSSCNESFNNCRGERMDINIVNSILGVEGE